MDKQKFDKYFKPIDLSNWRDEESPFHFASKTKDILINPRDDSKWLYKLPTENRKRNAFRSPWDFWMEIIAYLLSSEIGFDVPETFVGTRIQYIHGEFKTTYRSLQYFFQSSKTDFKHGEELLSKIIPDYKKKRELSLKNGENNEYYNFELISKYLFHIDSSMNEIYPSTQYF